MKIRAVMSELSEDCDWMEYACACGKERVTRDLFEADGAPLHRVVTLKAVHNRRINTPFGLYCDASASTRIPLKVKPTNCAPWLSRSNRSKWRSVYGISASKVSFNCGMEAIWLCGVLFKTA